LTAQWPRPAVWLFALFLLLAALVAARAALRVTQGLQGEYLLEPSSAPVLTVTTPEISTGQMTTDWNGSPPPAFRARWFGYLAIGRSSVYTFATSSDDGSMLAIDGKVVVDNGGVHGLQTQTGRVRLEPGSHFVLIEYVQAGGDYDLSWSWAPEGAGLSRVPAWVLSPRRLSYTRALAANVLDQAALAALVLLGLGMSWLAVKHGHTPAWHAARRYPRLASFALFVALALVETWPLATNPAHLSRNDNGDTVLNEWTLAWVVHQAPRAPLRLYEANIFHPEHDTLAYSESMIVQSAMAAPLFRLGASPVLAYNLVLLAGFVLTGWAVTLVVARWTGDWVAALVSGILAGFNAHTLSRLPHLQAQHAEFLPLALVALDALFREPRLGHALRLAGWFTLQALTSVYLLVFTAFALTAAALARPDAWVGERFRKVARLVALAAVLAALALLPFILPYWRAYHDQGLTRSLVDARWFSASPGDYLETPARLHWAWWSYRWWTSGNALFPGVLGLTLTAVAIVTGVAFRDARARMCLAMGACGVFLSFGPKVPGYALLYQFVPLLQAVRAPVRFGYLGIVAVAILAGFGVAELRSRLPIRIWPPLTAVMLVTAVIEPLAAPLQLSAFDDIPRIYARVPPEPDAVVVELPFPSSQAVFHNAKYMLNSTRHWKPMLNGYSGFVPASYYQHFALLERFPSAESIAVLQRLKVTYLFVHADAYGPQIVHDLERVPALTTVAAEGPIVLYRLRGIQ
jgi:hypothetical protein